METKNNNSMIIYNDNSGGEVKLNIPIVKKYLNSLASEQEIMYFITVCKAIKANPFLRDVHLVKYANSPADIILGKGYYMKVAARNPNYDGLEAGIIVERNGKTERIIGACAEPTDKLRGGWAKVYRKDMRIPFNVEVSFDEYRKKTKDGRPMSTWATIPTTMIRKVAIVQAMREAFPQDLEIGIYDRDEVGRDINKSEEDPIIINEDDYIKTSYADQPSQGEGEGQEQEQETKQEQPLKKKEKRKLKAKKEENEVKEVKEETEIVDEDEDDFDSIF